MAYRNSGYLEHGPRVGRSQGTNFFWGLVSVCFAAAACFYFWKNNENEVAANKYRNEVATLQDNEDNLKAQREKLQTDFADQQTRLKTQEDLLTEKESRLADEQTRLESLGQQVQGPGATPQGQIAAVRKFSDTLRKIAQDQNAEVVTRGGRPVLRIANASFFGPGDSTLTPGGQAVLDQITQGLKGSSDNFELRMECFADSTAEATQSTAGAPPTPGTFLNASWALTASRSTAVAVYLRDKGVVPWQNVVVVPRGDTSKKTKLEVTLAPVPPIYKASAMAAPTPPPAPIESPAPAKP